MRPRFPTTVLVLTLVLLTLTPTPGLEGQDGRISLESYLEMESVSDPQLSPDGSRVIFTRGGIDGVKDGRGSATGAGLPTHSRTLFPGLSHETPGPKERRIQAGRFLHPRMHPPSFGPPRGAPPGQEQDPRIAAVEKGLSRAIQVRGWEAERFSIQERLAFYNVPGVSVAVLDGGRLVWGRGYGVTDVNTGKEVTPETLFQAASISKPVAATAALKLVEEGVLELDAPVNRYLTRWKIPDNDFTRDTPVTLKHLLTHTGGLTVHGFPGYAVTDQVATTRQVLDGSGPANTAPIRVDTIPGSLWRYSGGGYTIIQQLLEDVTGKPFPQIVRELVLDPAGMTGSSYAQPLPEGRARKAATAHLGDGSPVEGKWHIYPEMAAAGLWTTPVELSRLAADLQASLNGDPNRILSPEMTRRMLTPVMGGYGLGFGVRGEGEEGYFNHGGSNHGFKATFMAYLEGGRGVFVMTNGNQGSPLAQEIVLAVAREFDWPYPRAQEVVLAEISEEALEEVAGRYQVREPEIEVLVEVLGDHLRVEAVGYETFEIHPTGPDFFMDLTDGGRVRVDRNGEGEIEALEFSGTARAVRVGK